MQAGSHAGAKDFVQHVQDLLGQDKVHLEKAHEHQKWYYDCHHRYQEQVLKDWALLSIRNPHLAAVKKLYKCFVGPYQVLQDVGQYVYKLGLKGRFLGVHDIFHVSQLKPLT